MPNEARVKRKKEERLEAAAAKTPKLDIYFGTKKGDASPLYSFSSFCSSRSRSDHLTFRKVVKCHFQSPLFQIPWG